MRSHIEMQTQENIDAGMNPEQARYAALRQFGWMESIKETCREQRGVNWIENLGQDVRYGARMLRKNPCFTAVAVLTLALGMGANTAIYSVVNTVLLNPVPGPEPNRLMQIGECAYDTHNKAHFYGVSPPVLEALRANPYFFSDFVWLDGVGLERKAEDFSDYVAGEMVSPNFFTLWNIRPILGRTFAKDEATPVDENGNPTGDSVVVLSYASWQKLFAGDAGVIGKTIELSGRHFTVVGVMPPHFRFPREVAPLVWVAAEPRCFPAGEMTGPKLYRNKKPGRESSRPGFLFTPLRHLL